MVSNALQHSAQDGSAVLYKDQPFEHRIRTKRMSLADVAVEYSAETNVLDSIIEGSDISPRDWHTSGTINPGDIEANITDIPDDVAVEYSAEMNVSAEANVLDSITESSDTSPRDEPASGTITVGDIEEYIPDIPDYEAGEYVDINESTIEAINSVTKLDYTEGADQYTKLILEAVLAGEREAKFLEQKLEFS